MTFRNQFAEDIFNLKYRHEGCETWPDLCRTLVHEVCDGLMPKDEVDDLVQYMTDMKFLPGGRYIYYAGRDPETRYYNNCFLLKAEEDTRQDWAKLAQKATSALMSGGGIGIDYSVYRPSGSHLKRTGGKASGPLPMMELVNGIGRSVMQGGSRRSAIYASLHWQHGDVKEFLKMKNWNDQVVGDTTIGKLKEADFNFRAPMDFTNISINYDTAWQNQYWDTGDVGDVFMENVRQALSTSEPGFSFNYMKDDETLRNACTEVTSADPDDVCNLGSINMSRILNITEFADVVTLATKFLLCGTIRGKVPYEAVERTRKKNRRLGLGLMGMHEWLIQEENAMKLPMNFISGCTSTRRLAMLPVDLSLIIVQLVVLSLTGPLLLLAVLASWLAQVRGSNRSLLSPISGVICEAVIDGITSTLWTVPRKN